MSVKIPLTPFKRGNILLFKFDDGLFDFVFDSFNMLHYVMVVKSQKKQIPIFLNPAGGTGHRLPFRRGCHHQFQ
jgi:hypothetical protein